MAGRQAKRVRSARKVTVSFIGAGVHFTGDLVDLSETGVLIRCSENIPLETVGRLGIEMTPNTFRTLGVVRRQVPSVGIALRFTQMTPHDRDLLHHLMLRLRKLT